MVDQNSQVGKKRTRLNPRLACVGCFGLTAAFALILLAAFGRTRPELSRSHDPSSPYYFPTPKEFKQGVADLNAMLEKKQVEVAHRIPEKLRRKIYFDIQQAENRSMAHISENETPASIIDRERARVTKKYGVSKLDLAFIWTEGRKAGWPPKPTTE